MKGKETATYLFREQWEEARETLVQEIIKTYPPKIGARSYFEVSRQDEAYYKCATESREMREWEMLHPRPKTTRDQLIVQLANRVAVLEAALAEKGGAE